MEKKEQNAANAGEQGRANFATGSATQGGSNYGQGSSALGGEAYQQGDTSNAGANYDNETDRLGDSTVGTNREGAQAPDTGAHGADGTLSEERASLKSHESLESGPYNDKQETSDTAQDKSMNLDSSRH